MSKKSLRDLIEEEFDTNSTQLPVFNLVALKLQELKNSKQITLQQFTDLIMCDPALAVRILQTANSAFYGGLKQVTTILGAVQRLGMSRVASLAMVASQLLVHTAKLKMVSGYMPDLWRHSLLTATGMQWLAPHVGYANQTEEAFLCGLLHNIGKLFLLKALDAAATNENYQIKLTDALIEEVLTSMHTDIGYRLMIKWELPDMYATVARDHHNEEIDESNTLLVMVRLINVIHHKLGVGQPAEPNIVLAATSESQILGIKEIRLAQLEVMLEDAVTRLDTNEFLTDNQEITPMLHLM
ncbi:HDOD domain-containing protein [Thiospirillum jenense]|uniref:HDOD domain-containing protein n=1 Tax=Thiospirillum jenense TaxID=1653858 RepID=A0A839HFS3_9GAMM|nr:HDOD domain-containing protein [Thiospirillum jenense]